MAKAKFQNNDPIKYKIKVEKFAAEQIEKFSKQQSRILDHKEKHRIKEGLITILEPLCASVASKDMSWGQAWKSFRDKAKDTIFKLFGKENNLKQIMDKHSLPLSKH